MSFTHLFFPNGDLTFGWLATGEDCFGQSMGAKWEQWGGAGLNLTLLHRPQRRRERELQTVGGL